MADPRARAGPRERRAQAARTPRNCPLDLSTHTGPRVRPHIRHGIIHTPHDETTTFNVNFSTTGEPKSHQTNVLSFNPRTGHLHTIGAIRPQRRVWGTTTQSCPTNCPQRARRRTPALAWASGSTVASGDLDLFRRYRVLCQCGAARSARSTESRPITLTASPLTRDSTRTAWKADLVGLRA